MEQPQSIADRLFDAHDAECELLDLLADVPHERLGWDWYDSSLEIHGVPPDFRLSAEVQRACHGAGFAKVYLNHTDKWETHYSFGRESFEANAGWRVSYPHKRGPGEKSIWVEKHIPGWPQEWFDTGLVLVKAPGGEEGAGG
jgi:hypothetical protein